ncbi:MAG: preprotein translocase subunit SecE [Dehalococcoidia bacterium]|nr:preprotein translocase subunit SecE [Dehalococcoidia bacterium]
MRREAVTGRSVISRLRGYIGEIISELRKVVWPTREETRRLTLMVIAIALAVGLFLGAIDLGFTRLVNLLLGG